MFLLPRVSFRRRRFRCSHEAAIELKVLLANKKLMFHSDLLEGMDLIVVQEREGRGRIICRNDRGRRQQAWASRHQHGTDVAQAVSRVASSHKDGQAGMPSERSITIAL